MAMRKRDPIPWEKINGMLMYEASLNVVAEVAGCSHDTLEREIKKLHGCNFTEYRQRYVDQTVLRIKTKMINKALTGDNTCMIFCLKNLAKWADRVDHSVDDSAQKTLVLKYSVNSSKLKRLKEDEIPEE
jgi:hypothetical protein